MGAYLKWNLMFFRYDEDTGYCIDRREVDTRPKSMLKSRMKPDGKKLPTWK